MLLKKKQKTNQTTQNPKTKTTPHPQSKNNPSPYEKSPIYNNTGEEGSTLQAVPQFHRCHVD